MKKWMIAICVGMTSIMSSVNGQTNASAQVVTTTQPDAETDKKAGEWAASLNLNDAAKESRLKAAIANHLTAVKDWHNSHPASSVPAGINPTTGKLLSEMERDIIANSALPKSVYEILMNSLRKELTEEQVNAVLDKYTIGKVAFTMKAYREIVPNITPLEDSIILSYMLQAREQAIDFKNMKEISAIFEIYKTKSEQYLNANGRNWREMYKTYTNMLKAQKAAQSAPK